MAETIVVVPGSVTLEVLARIYWSGAGVALDPSVRPAVAAACARVSAVAAGDVPVYGINTGFGKLASITIPAADAATLQRNLIRSHCAGVGEPLSRRITRLVMALKLVSLGRGASGVRPAVIELLEGMLAGDVTPIVPAQGSVGASGDLAPLAHLAAVLMGEGEAEFDGIRQAGAPALAAAGLAPLELGPKEGLALINGTQVSTALALAGLFEGWRCALGSIVTASLSTEAIMGSTAPLLDEIHRLRGHRGQIDTARSMRGLLAGSAIRDSHLDGDERVQDPYCIRCQPQVTGACIDLMRFVGGTLETESNAATDNPLVLGPEHGIVSGGNFHAEPVALAADQLALALAEIGSISQRRVALMVDPTLNFGLPPFLTPEPGLCSGLMIAEVTSAALMSENKQMASPCSVDSTPTSANQEDHVSMACHAARRLGPMTENLGRILGIELICAAQGIEFRRPLETSEALERTLERLREVVAPLTADRAVAADIEAAAGLVRSGAIGDAAGAGLLPALDQAASA